MKDYTLTESESKNFILNYKKQDNKLIINLANGKKRIMPNTEKNEQKIICKMEEQVMDSKNLLKFLKKRMAGNNKVMIESSAAMLVVLMLYFFGVVTNITLIAFTLIVAGVVDAVTCVKNGIDLTKVKDLEKNIAFIENKQKINDKKGEKNVLENMKSRTRNKAKEKPVFTINDMDAFTVSQFEDMMDAINYVDDFNQQEITEEKQKRLTYVASKNDIKNEDN